jgi:hypothetical protein
MGSHSYNATQYITRPSKFRAVPLKRRHHVYERGLSDISGDLKSLGQKDLNFTSAFLSHGFEPGRKPDRPVYWQTCSTLCLVFVSPDCSHHFILCKGYKRMYHMTSRMRFFHVFPRCSLAIRSFVAFGCLTTAGTARPFYRRCNDVCWRAFVGISRPSVLNVASRGGSCLYSTTGFD